MGKITPIILMIVFFLLGEAKGDTLYLKNGRRMEGRIKKETLESVELDLDIGTVTFARDQIERIDKSRRINAAPGRQEFMEEKREDRISYDEYIGKEELDKNPEIKEVLKRHILAKEIIEEARKDSFLKGIIDDINIYIKRMWKSAENRLNLEKSDLRKNPELEYALKTRIVASDISDRVERELKTNPGLKSFLDNIIRFLRESLNR